MPSTVLTSVCMSVMKTPLGFPDSIIFDKFRELMYRRYVLLPAIGSYFSRFATRCASKYRKKSIRKV